MTGPDWGGIGPVWHVNAASSQPFRYRPLYWEHGEVPAGMVHPDALPPFARWTPPYRGLRPAEVIAMNIAHEPVIWERRGNREDIPRTLSIPPHYCLTAGGHLAPNDAIGWRDVNTRLRCPPPRTEAVPPVIPATQEDQPPKENPVTTTPATAPTPPAVVTTPQEAADALDVLLAELRREAQTQGYTNSFDNAMNRVAALPQFTRDDGNEYTHTVVIQLHVPVKVRAPRGSGRSTVVNALRQEINDNAEGGADRYRRVADWLLAHQDRIDWTEGRYSAVLDEYTPTAIGADRLPRLNVTRPDQTEEQEQK